MENASDLVLSLMGQAKATLRLAMFTGEVASL
jgi:hypothetical protein